MLRRALPFLLLVLLVPVLVPAASGQSSVESELLSLINRGRPGDQLTAHSGLKIVARQHSQEMSSAGGLNHNGAAQRIQTAPPDPTESNGPPDDGFTGTWCENVAYVRGAPENEVAQRVYQGWTNSSSHNRCMNDSRMTVAGIGLYFDGNETYWATLEAAVDETLPGSTPETPSPSPEPAATPESTDDPAASAEPTERPTPTPREVPTERPTPTARPIFGGTSPSPQMQRGAENATAGLSRGATGISRGAGRVVGSTERLHAAPTIRAASEQTPFNRAGLATTVAIIFGVADVMRRLSKRRKDASSP